MSAFERTLKTHLVSYKETRLDALEMKGLRKIMRVSWTAKKTNEFLTKLE